MNIKAVEAAVKLPYKQGLQREAELSMLLFTSNQASALQYAFFAERAATKVLDAVIILAYTHRCQPSGFDREPPGAGVPLPVGKILPVNSRYSPDPVQKYFKPHFHVTASLSYTQRLCMKHGCWGCSVCGW